MGIQEFDAVFDILDPALQGYITSEQVQEFHETLYFSPIILPQVDAAVLQICGPDSNGKIHKHFFVQVLEELDRRKSVEVRARWDFMSLDKEGNNRIPLEDALTLFKMTHGPNMSLHTWKQFVSSRELPELDVSFDEVRMWLCNLPDGKPCTSDELIIEESRILSERNEKDGEDFDNYVEFQNELTHSAIEAKKKEDYRDRTKRMARRKQFMWEKDGVEALLYDDGIDRGEVIPDKIKNKLNINDVLDALSYKYNSLTKKLFWYMIKKNMGSALFASMSDHEQYETFHQLEVQYQQMCEEGSLRSRSEELPNSSVDHNVSLYGTMGDLEPVFSERLHQYEERRAKLKSSGKNDEAIDKIFKDEFEKNSKVSTKSSDMLCALYERYQQERQQMLGLLRDTGSESPMSVLLQHLSDVHQQNIMLDQEEEFTAASVAAGLAERQQEYRRHRFDPDRVRQELLAAERLLLRKGRKLRLTDEDNIASPLKRDNMADLQLDILKEVTGRHALEREVLIHLLQGKDSNSAKSAARQMSHDQKLSKLTNLRNQRNSWRENTPENRSSQKNAHLRILQEGAGVYYDDRRQNMNKASEDMVNASVLADLQQRQDEEMATLKHSMTTKTDKDIRILRKRELKTHQAELLDNIAFVVLGAFQCSEDEKLYIDALERKYDALRMALYMHELKLEHGGTWDRLSNEEKARLLNRKSEDEKRLRQDGRMEEMSKLVPKTIKNLEKLRVFVGEDRTEYDKRMAAMEEYLHQVEMKGQTVNQTPHDDEANAQTVKSVNLLADVTSRFLSERDAVMGKLRSHDSSAEVQQVLLVCLKLEAIRAAREPMFDLSAFSLGLAERIPEARTSRHKADQQRQRKLATLRVAARKKRMLQDVMYVKEKDEALPPPEGDSAAWNEALFLEMHKKHRDEWEIMLSILLDHDMEELRDAAETLPEKDKQIRLAQLRAIYQHLELDDPGQREENFNIMEEAAAIRLVQKKHLMDNKGDNTSWDDSVTALQVELQDEQDKEIAVTLLGLPQSSEEDVKLIRMDEILSRKNDAGENVVNVLTKYEGIGEDDELLKALDEKYDALRDKLLLDLLMKQTGESEWMKLSEEERQKKLAQLKLKERQLRRDGKWEEVYQLLGEGSEQEAALQKLMGDNRSDYERKLQDRLARRKRRAEQGLDPDESDSGIDENDDEADGDNENMFDSLQERYEEEKEALLTRLRGMNDEFLTEKERQAELVRLRREKRKAEQEDNFDNAARLIGLAERQRAQVDQRLKNDRSRQEQLAKERLAALRAKKAEKRKKTTDEEVIREGSKDVLQDAIMKLLDENHDQERELLSQLLSKAVSADQKRQLAKSMSHLERADRLQQFKDQRSETYPEKVNENSAILEESCIIKLEDKKEKLEAQTDNLTDEDVEVSLMADLQEYQDAEAAKYINDITTKDEGELIELQVKLMYNKKYQRGENVACMLFTTESSKAGETELLEALESKYDALRDKLLAEALIQQVGEREWLKLSEQEKQKRLVELKLKEKQLRKEGKMDEAAQLLGTAFQEHEALENMIGLSQKEQERKLKERLEKRKERLASGLSEEECDQLEEQDIEEEENERRKERRNILLDLQHQYDQEKEALMRGIKDRDNHLVNERLRQSELARLRREQRRAKQEDNFDAAAIALGLSRSGDHKKEMERKRQLELARQRLEARRNQKNQKPVRVGRIEAPDDTEDLIGMQEAVIKEIERKQLAEQQAFHQILQDAQSSPNRAAAKELNSDQRKEKLEELRHLRRSRRNSESRQIPEKEHTDLLKDAAVLQFDEKAIELRHYGKNCSDDDIQVELVADLQEKQGEEMHKVLNTIHEKDFATLQQMKDLHLLGFQQKWYDNAAHVLLGEEKEVHDPTLNDKEKELVQELEQKYDDLRDKLLTEALMKQMGEKEWAKLSERERQARLVKIKLQERKLREEGRYEEAAALLGQLAHQQEDLSRKLGDTRTDQKRKLNERLKRRKELFVERQSKGLSTEDAILDAILEDEDSKLEKQEENKRTNVLENLQHHFEDEKAEILALLRKQQTATAIEQQRQLEIARLKRERRRMDKEDKFDAAAVLVSVSAEQESVLGTNLAKERERQRQLAKDRLAAKRRRAASKKAGKMSDEMTVDQLRQEEEERRLQLVVSAANDGQGGLTIQEDILNETERKQEKEREMLVELISAAENDKANVKAAQALNSHDLKMHLEKMRQERNKWKKKSQQAAFKMAEEESKMSTGEKDKYLAQVVQSRNEQFRLLTKAMVYRLQVEKGILKKENQSLSDKQITEETTVTLLAELQEKQEGENNMLIEFISKQNMEGLEKLREAEAMASREGWLENLANTIFTLLDSPFISTGAVGEELEQEAQKMQDQMEQGFQQQQQQLQEKLERQRVAGDPVDVKVALAKLQKDQDATRRTLLDGQNRQRELLRKRLEARKHEQDRKEYEHETANELLKMMERTQTFLQDKTDKEKGKQGNLLQQRLAERREAKRLNAKMTRRREEGLGSRESSLDVLSRPSSNESDRPHGSATRRERTVVQDVSEEKKREMVKKLVRQQKVVQDRISSEQERQNEMLQRRLEARKGKRDSIAEALISRGHRHKTILEKSQKDEKERQIGMLKDRVAKVRYERTQTMRVQGDKASQQFSEMVEDKGASHEKMESLAKDMEESFKKEEQAVKDGKKKSVKWKIEEEEEDS